jgi:hypothetical protein
MDINWRSGQKLVDSGPMEIIGRLHCHLRIGCRVRSRLGNLSGEHERARVTVPAVRDFRTETEGIGVVQEEVIFGVFETHFQMGPMTVDGVLPDVGPLPRVSTVNSRRLDEHGGVEGRHNRDGTPVR